MRWIRARRSPSTAIRSGRRAKGCRRTPSTPCSRLGTGTSGSARRRAWSDSTGCSSRCSTDPTRRGCAATTSRRCSRTATARLWVGTNGGGVTRRKEDSSLTASTHEGLAGDQVNCLFEDRSGVVWIGTTAGLSRFVEPALHFGRDSAGGPEQGHPLDRRGPPRRDLDRDGGGRAAAPARRALDARKDRRPRQEPDPGDRQGPQREPLDRNRRGRPRELEGRRRGPLLGVERPGGKQDPLDPRGPGGKPLDRHRRRGALAPGQRQVDVLFQGSGALEQLGRLPVRGPRGQPLDRNARRRAQPPLRRKLHALRLLRGAELRRRFDLSPDPRRLALDRNVGRRAQPHEGRQGARPYASRDGLSYDEVSSLAEDRDGNIWVGTWGGGLNHLVKGRFHPRRSARGPAGGEGDLPADGPHRRALGRRPGARA